MITNLILLSVLITTGTVSHTSVPNEQPLYAIEETKWNVGYLAGTNPVPLGSFTTQRVIPASNAWAATFTYVNP